MALILHQKMYLEFKNRFYLEKNSIFAQEIDFSGSEEHFHELLDRGFAVLGLSKNFCAVVIPETKDESHWEHFA